MQFRYASARFVFPCSSTGDQLPIVTCLELSIVLDDGAKLCLLLGERHPDISLPVMLINYFFLL